MPVSLSSAYTQRAATVRAAAAKGSVRAASGLAFRASRVVGNSSKTKVYGFNSDTPVGDNETEVNTTGDKDKNETTSKTTRKGSKTLTREGNIGVTTSMQMLTQEIEGRQYDFWENVFADIDRLLCFMIRGV